MAFISGYKTKYKCKLCGVECEFGHGYKHPNNIIFINGYPSSCENNDKIITQDEISLFKEPIIQTFGRTSTGEQLY